jgi:hypothetical protein
MAIAINDIMSKTLEVIQDKPSVVQRKMKEKHNLS